ncbi:MAG: hypothetical protein QM731_08380 [Chitinophagaceae bacterium]
MTTPIQLLPHEEFKVLKIIRIDGPEWNWFTGHLPYLRTFDPKTYDSMKGDLLDERILSTIQQNYPQATLRYNNDILFKGELEDNLKWIEGGTRKDITIQFFPLIPYDIIAEFVGRDFFAYPFNFQLRLNLGSQNQKLEWIHDFFLCNLPHDKITELVKTIQPI